MGVSEKEKLWSQTFKQNMQLQIAAPGDGKKRLRTRDTNLFTLVTYLFSFLIADFCFSHNNLCLDWLYCFTFTFFSL